MHGIARSRDPSVPRKHKEKSADNSSLATDVDSNTPPQDSEIVESRKPCYINSKGPGISNLFGSSNVKISIFMCSNETITLYCIQVILLKNFDNNKVEGIPKLVL